MWISVLGQLIRLEVIACVASTAAVSAAAHPDHPHHSPHDHGGAHVVHNDAPGVSMKSLRRTEQSLMLQSRKSPENTAILAKLAQTQLSLARRSGDHHDYEVAGACFGRLVELDGGSATGRIGRAYASLGTHEFGSALENARVAALLEPDHPAVLALLADAHLASGNYAEASQFASRLVEDELTLETLARVALVASERGDHARARAFMTDAKEAGRLLDAPPTQLAWCETMLGDIEADAGRLNESAAHYASAMEIDDGAHAAAAGLASVLMHRGDVAEAVRVLEAVVDRAPLPRYRVLLADALLLAGNAEELARASELLQLSERAMSREIAFGDLAHARELVEYWCTHGGNAERAATLAVGELRQIRRDRDGYVTAAWALLLADRTEEALPHAESALLIAPSHTRTLLRCGVVLYENGRHTAARACLQRGLARDSVQDPLTLARARDAAMELGLEISRAP